MAWSSWSCTCMGGWGQWASIRPSMTLKRPPVSPVTALKVTVLVPRTSCRPSPGPRKTTFAMSCSLGAPGNGGSLGDRVGRRLGDVTPALITSTPARLQRSSCLNSCRATARFSPLSQVRRLRGAARRGGRGVIWGAGVTTGPGGPEPGTSDDPGSVRVALAAGAGVAVEAAGPGRLHGSVVGEGGEGFAGPPVGGPAEIDAGGLARGSRDRRSAAFCGAWGVSDWPRHAAHSYSWISPPRTSRRRSWPTFGALLASPRSDGSGVAKAKLRCERCRL